MLQVPLDDEDSTGDHMEQDEPDVVELQNSDEGDIVQRVFIGEGGSQKWGEGGWGAPDNTERGYMQFGDDPDIAAIGIWALIGGCRQIWRRSRYNEEGVEVFGRGFKALLAISRHCWRG